MAGSSKYHFLLSEETYRFVVSSRTSDRQILDDTFRYLADHPHLGGDYQEQNSEGLQREVFLRRNFLVTFWTDHAAKKVRIVRVEKV